MKPESTMATTIRGRMDHVVTMIEDIADNKSVLRTRDLWQNDRVGLPSVERSPKHFESPLLLLFCVRVNVHRMSVFCEASPAR